jgi:hypothetical protein
MKLWMLSLLLALLAPAAISRTLPQAKKPARPSFSAPRHAVYRLTGKLVFEGRVVSGSIRQSEIESLLARRVELGGQQSDFGKYGVGYVYENGRFPAFSCQEWALGRVLGLNDNFNTYERAMDSFYVDTCSFLFALRGAKPARRSFIANPNVGLSDLNLLPANLLKELSGEGEDEMDKMTARGARISGLVAKRVVKVKARTKTSLVLDYDFASDISRYTSEMSLLEMGRADFDGDGIEDIYVSAANYAIGGTFRYYAFLLLTRRSRLAGFEVRRLELPALKANPAASTPEINLKSSELKQANIAQTTYGKSWPFEADKGTLACARAGSVAVFFITAGKTYPLNVWARGAKIDGVAVSSETPGVLNGENLSAIFDKAFAMCPIQ